MNEALIAIIAEIRAGLNAYGYGEYPVLKAFQSSKQGRAVSGLYYNVTNVKNHGWQARRYNPVGKSAGHTEHQLYEATMRLTALVRDDRPIPSTDLAALAQRIVNSLPFQEALQKKGFGVQRASAIVPLPIINEQDNYETEASFTFNFTYTQSIAPDTGIIDGLNIDGIMRI